MHDSENKQYLCGNNFIDMVEISYRYLNLEEMLTED
jgi:hypothetical protein